MAPLGKLRTADLFVVAPAALPRRALARIGRLPGVTAAQSLDAARVRVDGKLAAVLGVNPSQFRSFAARPTASSNRLWQSVASGGIAVSYTMGRLDKLPLGGKVHVAGVRQQQLRVGGFGTVGVTGVNAVVSKSAARSLGFPAGNAIVVSAPHARLSKLAHRISRVLPRSAVVEPLVSQPNASGAAGLAGVTRATGRSDRARPAGRRERTGPALDRRLPDAQHDPAQGDAQGRAEPGAAGRTSGAAAGRRCSTAPVSCSGRSRRQAWSCRASRRTRR